MTTKKTTSKTTGPARARRSRTPLLLTALAAGPASYAHAASDVAYRVAMPDPRTHEFEVELRVPAMPERITADVVMPAWAPGSYLVRDFARHVYGFAVQDERGRAVPFERVDKQRWRVASGGKPFRVRYRVFAFEASVRTSYLDDSHGFINGSSVFMFVDGELARPCRVEVVPPPRTPAWRVATALDAEAGAKNTYRAGDYDELADSPIEVGTHGTHTFKVGATEFELALYGPTNADPKRLVTDLTKIVGAAGAIFGGFPFTRYVFIVHALPTASGGLEHRASVTMDIAGMSFDEPKGTESFNGLAAHEFFHAWNVKRIRDRVLGPFDYTKENYTRLLWLHEGFTDYMARVILLRAGLLKPKDFLKWIGDEWPKYAARPGRSVTPLSELSYEAWIKEYKPADNHYNATVSYYTKGMWAGMLFDLQLRQRSRGARGLPDFFRKLWDDFGARDRGITEDDVRAAAQAVAGASMDDTFARYIHGTEELPVPALLKQAGLVVAEPAAWEPDPPKDDKAKPDDKSGGEEAERARRERARAWSGITFGGIGRKSDPSDACGDAVVRNVIPGSPGFEAGITYGDEIVAVDGQRVDAGSFGKRIGDRRPGDTVRVVYFRRNQLIETRMKLVANPERRLVLRIDEKADGAAKAIRQGWLGR